MSAPQLALEWREEPDAVRSGVVQGAIAFCSCGYREAFTVMAPKVNRSDAEDALDAHLAGRCPLRGTS